MKITFIYAYDGESWSTPYSLISEFQSRGWDTEIVSIGSNKTGLYTDTNLKSWLTTNPTSDIIMFMDWGRFDSPYLDKSLVNAFWIQESGDDPQNFIRNSQKAHKFHVTLTPDYPSYELYKQRGINAHWWTHFADTRIYWPMDDVEITHLLVSSRGRGGSAFLDKLEDVSNGMMVNKNGFIGIDHGRFLNSGFMVIQNSRWGEITRRIFEGMACGRLVITDRLSPERKLDELFKEGKDIVLYSTLEECVQKINYYAEHQEHAWEIAQAGFNAVMNNHTQVHRVNTILDLYEEYIHGS